MKTGRPRYRNRKPLTSQAYRDRLRADDAARHERYVPPPSSLPPKPPWLKIGVRVAILTPVSAKCASGTLATVYEIRPTADGETWEVGVQDRGMSVGGSRRFRLHNPQEFVEWMPNTP